MLRRGLQLPKRNNLTCTTRYLSEWQKNVAFFYETQKKLDPNLTSPNRYNMFIYNDVEEELAENSNIPANYAWTKEAKHAREERVIVEKTDADNAAEKNWNAKLPNDPYIPYAMSFLPML